MAVSLLASAASLADIQDAIRDFYCGSSKTLIPDGADAWRVVNTHDGKTLDGVRVTRKRGRLRFEMVH